jgi:hypothetical protein
VPGSRHLHPTQAEGALRRGGQVEQLLGIDPGDGSAGVVRWASVCVVQGRFELRLHAAEDIGSSDFADVAAFPSADPDDEFGEGRVVASASEASKILEVASAYGALADQWVNQGVIDDEYLTARWGGA